MGKKGKKVDIEKKLALQAKKDAKQEKAALKRLSKATNADGNDDVDDEVDAAGGAIDEVLRAYKSQDRALMDQKGIDKPTLEVVPTEFPLPRANATLEFCADDRNKEHFYLFGGEYFDGVENIVLDELYRFDALKKEWKQVLTAPRPPPRCAHSCISYKSSLYIFGGELATSDQYHHYRDLWKLDINTLKWTEITTKNPPSARSGHACIVWKNYMILFGGFFEALRETKWYNDVHVFNLQTELWMEIPQSRLSVKPEPRSACNIALFGTDKAIIHGGFSKLKTSNVAAETRVHTDAWVLNLAPLQQSGKAPTWERWMSSTKAVSSLSPNGRAGTACVSYKNRMLVFGGVVDKEELNHKVDSVFYNDLMAMDIDRRKWFPLRVKEKIVCSSGGPGTRRRRKTGIDNDVDDEVDEMAVEIDAKMEEDDGSSSDLEEEEVENYENQNAGWDLDMLRSNMFAFIDGGGNIVYEKIEDDDDDDKGESKEEEDDEEEKEEEKDEEEETKEEEKEEVVEGSKSAKTPVDSSTSNGSRSKSDRDPRIITSSSVMVLNASTNVPEAVVRTEPLPRINASVLVQGHTMYMLGGILEVGDREVTLDDMWSLDLKKRDQWDCLWQGTMHKQVWRGAIHDDDDSYVSTGKEDGGDDDDDYDDFGDDDDEVMEGLEPKKSNSKKSSKKSKASAGLRQEVSEMNERYGLDDVNRTPNSGESLADFYSRTSTTWNNEAATQLAGTDSDLSNKELKRQGFILAKDRYEELRPVLDRMAELGIGQDTGGDDDRDGSKSNDPSSKKEKKKSSRR
jgi:N-acetylneuraminic acid mutarotase